MLLANGMLPSGPTAGERCSGHGTCSAGACQCTGGYHGIFCGSPPECGGVVDASGVCCDGRLDGGGACCTGANACLDGNAICCPAGDVDVCGVCGGGALTVDVAGRCCASIVDGQVTAD